MIFLHRTFLGERYFHVLHLDTDLKVHLALASRPGWLVLFLLVLVEGELQLYQLVSGVGLAHLVRIFRHLGFS